MKTVVKGACPSLLEQYATAFPGTTWEAMRNDAANGGDDAYTQTRIQLFVEQCGLCAYCERTLLKNEPYTLRVEHFHPKSDNSTGHNWHTDWQNLLLTCTGGERDGKGFPLPKNLSCDALKKDVVYDGEILNPLHLPPFPAAFCYNMGSGELVPNPKFCAEHPSLPGNTLPSTHDLLLNTLYVLNLNCDRLCQARLAVSRFLEKQKKQFRGQHTRASIALPRLSQQYFSKPWPQYFTVLRHCLQPYADDYLLSINYQG